MTISIVRTVDTCFGKARIEGTRWPVWIAWQRCVEGDETAEQVHDDYPHLSIEQIQAAIDYARGNWDEVHADWQRAQGDDDL